MRNWKSEMQQNPKQTTNIKGGYELNVRKKIQLIFTYFTRNKTSTISQYVSQNYVHQSYIKQYHDFVGQKSTESNQHEQQTIGNTRSVVRPLRKSTDDLILGFHQERMVSTRVDEFESSKHLQSANRFIMTRRHNNRLNKKILITIFHRL